MIKINWKLLETKIEQGVRQMTLKESFLKEDILIYKRRCFEDLGVKLESRSL